ncbi:MAG: histidine triad nucleotide-binding protein [Desulfobacterales bacterium]|nr:histidine triad nucleotide-binding protein [Desulfobacterales bacterium]
MTDECLFCRIAEGRTDTKLMFEDDTLVVFKDIHPHAPVHLLVVPKKHIRSVNDLGQEDGPIVAHLISVARDMARQQGIDRSGYKLLFNVESGGGQVIFHLHLHLLGGRKR